MVLAPHFARLHAQNDTARLQRLVTMSTRAILLFSVPVVLVIGVFGETLLEVVFGAEYRRGYETLTVLAIGQLANAATGSVAVLLNMTGFERDTAKGFSVSALLNIALNLALIPLFGMMGAALASAISTTLWNGVLVWLVYRRLGIVSLAWASKRALN
jgi:O-antigen/teichoic acid export membrane protein